MAKHSNKHSRKHSRKNKAKKSYKNNNRKDKTKNKTKKRSLRRTLQKGGGSGLAGSKALTFTHPTTGEVMTGAQVRARPTPTPIPALAPALAPAKSYGHSSFAPYTIPSAPPPAGPYPPPPAPAPAVALAAITPKKFNVGIPLTQYFTKGPYGEMQEYGSSEPYSDHAPVLYNIDGQIIIIWNVACWANKGPYEKEIDVSGNYVIATRGDISTKIVNNAYPRVMHPEYTYNHKFNSLKLENLLQYRQRLWNIVLAIKEMSMTYKDAIFLLQELPPDTEYPASYLHEASKTLSIPMDKTNPIIWAEAKKLMADAVIKQNDLASEFESYCVGELLTIKKTYASESLIVFTKSNNNRNIIDLRNIDYGTLTGKMNAFLDSATNKVYISVHIPYKEYGFLSDGNPDINTVNVYREFDNIITQITTDYPNVIAIYFGGDFNKPLSIFNDTKYKYYTTTDNQAYSLRDNMGSRNEGGNIDLIFEYIVPRSPISSASAGASANSN